jgi:hypothetical protein
MDSATQTPLTFHFAPEIEEAAVSILWHEPDRLGVFLREIDPLAHITQPHIRIILEAIDLAWRQLGTTDFETIGQIITELAKLEEVGGKDALNRIYGIHLYRSNRENIDAIFAHYTDMLKKYAEARKTDPPTRVYRFTGGYGTVIRKKAKVGRTDHFWGESIINGRHYRTRVEVSPDGNTLNLRFDPKF